jgi:hypothetical protein
MSATPTMNMFGRAVQQYGNITAIDRQRWPAIRARPTWATKTPHGNPRRRQHAACTNTWAASGYAVIPDRLLDPAEPSTRCPDERRSSPTAGNMSILKFLEENNLAAQRGGQPRRSYPGEMGDRHGQPAARRRSSALSTGRWPMRATAKIRCASGIR